MTRLTVEATAYGPPWNRMQGTGVTSTGVDLRQGQQKLVVAVDPHVIPYGTKLRIPSNPFGDPDLVFTAADTGGAIKGNRLDFFVASGRQAQNAWGRRNVTVEIVGRGDPKNVAVLGQAGSRAGVTGTGTTPAPRTPPTATAEPAADNDTGGSKLFGIDFGKLALKGLLFLTLIGGALVLVFLGTTRTVGVSPATVAAAKAGGGSAKAQGSA